MVVSHIGYNQNDDLSVNDESWLKTFLNEGVGEVIRGGDFVTGFPVLDFISPNVGVYI